MSTNPVSCHAEASPARADISRPLSLLRGAPSVAALAAAAAVPAVAFAAGEPDAELLRLEAEFNAADKRSNDAVDAKNDAEESSTVEWPAQDYPPNIPMPPTVAAEAPATVIEHEMMMKYSPDHPYLTWHRGNEAALADAKDAYWDAEIAPREEWDRRLAALGSTSPLFELAPI